MSVQFGRWKFNGGRPSTEYLEKADHFLAPYGPDRAEAYSAAGMDIRYRGFHTTKESRDERQPHVSPSGAVIIWDGRLDNREELVRQFAHRLSIQSPDISIVAAAWERWGTSSFAKLLGDWALSIWNPNERSLTLAKDPIGTRHLYYSIEKDQLTWCTILDPLVLLAGTTFSLNEEYIAGWLSFFPAAHLTPYATIQAVPPSSFAVVHGQKVTIKSYWKFDPDKEIRYSTDAQYEEHFLALFRESVRRRLHADTPVLAELSGGMDSSSIVSMADSIIAGPADETPKLETLSYYNDGEPSWDERPYFSCVEQRRGRTGCHIDVGSGQVFAFDFDDARFPSTPDSAGRGSKTTAEFRACLASGGHRVVLSGVGGDEATGGVPTPTPELRDLMAGARLKSLAHQLKVWALQKRKPWLHLLLDAGRGFLSPSLVGVPREKRPAAWLDTRFVKRRRQALEGYETRLRLFGPRPSFQENVSTLDGLRRQLASEALPSDPPFEKRYPYLDRDLLEFLYAIPREQMVRPGQRRSLMRRALRNVVPEEILNRKRKAYASRSPLAAVASEWPSLMEATRHMLTSSLGIVDRKKFLQVLEKGREGREIPIVVLLRTLQIEFWLRALARWRVIAADPTPVLPLSLEGARELRGTCSNGESSPTSFSKFKESSAR